MIYILDYRENGKECHKTLNIEFVSNRFIKKYREFKDIINDFENKVKAYEKNINDRAQCIITKDLEKIKVLESEFHALKKDVESFKDSDVFEKRFELIEYLYKTNGIQFEGRDFWEDCVEPSTMNDLLEKAVVKDFSDETSKKKALTNAMKTALSSLFQNTGGQ